MPAKNAEKEPGGFTAEERAAMKERAAELRAEGKKGAKKADGLQDVLDKIAEMAPDDRALAERVHVAITSTAPDLVAVALTSVPKYPGTTKPGDRIENAVRRRLLTPATAPPSD